MKPLLEVKDVSLSYHSLLGETAALSHISFDLQPEEFLAIVGPSGCGKSTFLNLICGLLWRGSLFPIKRPASDICCKKTTCWNGAVYTEM